MYASDMILIVHTDASYLSVSKARSRAAGYFFLSDLKGSLIPADPVAGLPARPNGAVHVIYVIMKNVLASATEAKTGAVFTGCQDAVPIRQALIELGHPQPPTPVQVDNACAVGILNNTVKQRRSKAMDMRFYWVKDRIAQGQFKFFWKPGKSNLADYFTKFHSPAHHIAMRTVYPINALTASHRVCCKGVFSGTNIPYTESVLTYATNLIPAKSSLRRGRQAATKYNRPHNS